MLVPERWLKLQFERQIKRGNVHNAEINPSPTLELTTLAEPGEIFVVKVTSKSGENYWLSSRGLFLQKRDICSLLFRYENVRRMHWLHKNLKAVLIDKISTGISEKELLDDKQKHFDRLVVELAEKDVVLEGLDQAYLPIFEFRRGSPKNLVVSQ